MLLFAAGSYALAAPANAEVIRDFTTDATVNADTSLQLVETITYDYEGDFRHGIFRDIPLWDEMPDGSRRVYDVTVNSVTVDGAPAQFQEEDNDPFLRLRIGDPDTTITGAHTYVVTYTVEDALRPITADDMDDPLMPAGVSEGDVELFWDLVGTGWEVSILQAAGRVAGPADMISAKCFTGAQGSAASCQVAGSSDTAEFGPVALGPYEGMTAVTVFPKAAFTAPVTPNIQGPPLSPFVGLAVGLIPALALIIGPAAYALMKRTEDAGAALQGAPPQYSPPDGLTPAELAVGWKGAGSLDSRAMVATLVDLASHRWIDLSSEGSSLTVSWVGTGTPPLRPFEEPLVGGILGGQQSAVMSGYDKSLASQWTSSMTELETQAEASGRRNPFGDKPDQRWWWLAIVFVVAGAVTFGSLVFGAPALAALAGMTSFGALVGFIVARVITPRKETIQSAEFQAKVRGFEAVLGTDPAAARREFAHRLGLPPEAVFATFLPYAIVFDLENAWMGAFPDLTPEQLAPYGFFYYGSMAALIDSGTTSVASATTAPSSGSGGGGFSGGGGGGGGGGSW